MYLFSVFLHACVPQLMCDCQATMCEDRLFPSLLCVLEMEVMRLGSKQPYSPSHLGGPQPWLSKPVIFNDQTVSKNLQKFFLESESIMNVVRRVCCCLRQCVVSSLIQQWSRDLGTRPTDCCSLPHKLRSAEAQIMIL